MKPHKKTVEVGTGSAILILLLILDHIEKLGGEPNLVIRWAIVLTAIGLIIGAIKNFPTQNLPQSVQNFLKSPKRWLPGACLLAGTLGFFLLWFVLVSQKAKNWNLALLPTATPTATAPANATPPATTPTVLTPTLAPPVVPTSTATPFIVLTSTVTPAVTPTSTPMLIFHIVTEGEYVWCIAQKYYGKENGDLSYFICLLNQRTGQIGSDCNQLEVGEKLQIPTARDFEWAHIPDPLPTPGAQEGVDYFCKVPPRHTK